MKNVALTFAAVAALAATAQTIPSPASSLDSGARGVVAITPVDLSSYASKVEVTNVSKIANSAFDTATSAYSYGYDAYMNLGYGRPWTQWFKGEKRRATGIASGWEYVVKINDSGAVYINGAATNFAWIYIGQPTAGEVVRWWSPCLASGCAREVVEVFPIDASAQGVPGDFSVRVPSARSYHPAPDDRAI